MQGWGAEEPLRKYLENMFLNTGVIHVWITLAQKECFGSDFIAFQRLSYNDQRMLIDKLWTAVGNEINPRLHSACQYPASTGVMSSFGGISGLTTNYLAQPFTVVNSIPSAHFVAGTLDYGRGLGGAPDLPAVHFSPGGNQVAAVLGKPEDNADGGWESDGSSVPPATLVASETVTNNVTGSNNKRGQKRRAPANEPTQRKTRRAPGGGANAAENAKSASNICEHNRRKTLCKECNPGAKSGRCPHGRVRSLCVDCGGSGICEHKTVSYTHLTLPTICSV
eukprot:3933876-Rhodomonas_salina.1